MPTNDKRPWDAYGKSSPKPMDFPPKARVAPAPVSSGISFRELPEARLIDIVKCCQHYESKCAGRYPASTPAARFLFDLSRDIQDLCRVLVGRSDERETRIAHLETLTREWNSVFGGDNDPELCKIGLSSSTCTPSDLRVKLVQLAKERDDAISQLSTVQSSRESEVVGLRGALRDQRVAAREQQRVESERLRREAEDAVNEARARARSAEEAAARAFRDARARAEADAARASETAIARARAQADKEVSDARAQVASMREAMRSAEERARNETKAAREAAEAARIRASRAAEDAAEAARDAQLAERDAQMKIQQTQQACERRIEDVTQRYAATTDARRVRALEGHNAWLEQRVTELQTLVDALQRAIGRSSIPVSIPPPKKSSGHTPSKTAPYESFVRPGVGKKSTTSKAPKRRDNHGPTRVRKGDAVLAWVQAGSGTDPAQNPIAMYTTRKPSSASSSSSSRPTRVLCDPGEPLPRKAPPAPNPLPQGTHSLRGNAVSQAASYSAGYQLANTRKTIASKRRAKGTHAIFYQKM